MNLNNLIKQYEDSVKDNQGYLDDPEVVRNGHATAQAVIWELELTVIPSLKTLQKEMREALKSELDAGESYVSVNRTLEAFGLEEKE